MDYVSSDCICPCLLSRMMGAVGMFQGGYGTTRLSIKGLSGGALFFIQKIFESTRPRPKTSWHDALSTAGNSPLKKNLNFLMQ